MVIFLLNLLYSFVQLSLYHAFVCILIILLHCFHTDMFFALTVIITVSIITEVGVYHVALLLCSVLFYTGTSGPATKVSNFNIWEVQVTASLLMQKILAAFFPKWFEHFHMQKNHDGKSY